MGPGCASTDTLFRHPLGFGVVELVVPFTKVSPLQLLLEAFDLDIVLVAVDCTVDLLGELQAGEVNPKQIGLAGGVGGVGAPNLVMHILRF